MQDRIGTNEPLIYSREGPIKVALRVDHGSGTQTIFILMFSSWFKI